jgi:hypothetical protein
MAVGTREASAAAPNISNLEIPSLVPVQKYNCMGQSARSWDPTSVYDQREKSYNLPNKK